MVFLPTKAVILDDEILTNDWKSYYGMIRDFIAQLVGGDKAESIVITEGVINPTKGFVVVDNENELEVDELSQIKIDNFVEGNFIALTMANADRAVVLVHGEEADGGIITYSGVNETMKMGDVVLLRRDGNLWRQVDLSGYMRASDEEMFSMTSEYKVASLAQLSPYLENKALYAVGVMVWAVRNPEGMVPCDNTNEYRLDQFPAVSRMLANGVLPKVTYDEYNSAIETTGVCASFGYDEVNGKFYPPFLKPRVIEGTSYYPYISLYNATTAESMLQQQGILDECMVLYANMQAEYENFKAYVDEQLMRVTDAVDDAVATVEETRDSVIEEVNEAKNSAVTTVNDTATSAVQRVEDSYSNFDALYQEKSQGLITTANNQIVNIDNAAQENIAKSRTWATGEQAEVEVLEVGKLSSRGYADIAMAIANEEEDVPVDTSKLVALDSIRGPRGYNGKDGEGVPTGGNTGQVLVKASGTDYDTQWGTLDALPTQEGNAGKYLTTDGENASWADVGSGRNVGDIFYTTRLDSELNGAFECNGATYNTADFSGGSAIGDLLSGDKLPYVSLAEYETCVSTNGSCRAFGWDGGAEFRVPTLNDIYIKAGTASVPDEFGAESLPNIKGAFGGNRIGIDNEDWANGCFAVTNSTAEAAANITNRKGVQFDLDASRNSSTYQDGAKVNPDHVKYRAMVQLATGATDEALITATTALQQIADFKPTSITYWE